MMELTFKEMQDRAKRKVRDSSTRTVGQIKDALNE